MKIRGKKNYDKLPHIYTPAFYGQNPKSPKPSKKPQQPLKPLKGTLNLKPETLPLVENRPCLSLQSEG